MMNRRACVALGLSVALTAVAHAQGQPGACLRYGPDTVEVAGRLQRHSFYGAPGYGETPATDALESGFYLELAAPVCATTPGQAGDEPLRGVRRVQLVLDSAGYARLRPLLSRRVAVRGTLYPASTGHHHAPLLLQVLAPVRAQVGR